MVSTCSVGFTGKEVTWSTEGSKRLRRQNQPVFFATEFIEMNNKICIIYILFRFFRFDDSGVRGRVKSNGKILRESEHLSHVLYMCHKLPLASSCSRTEDAYNDPFRVEWSLRLRRVVLLMASPVSVKVFFDLLLIDVRLI